MSPEDRGFILLVVSIAAFIIGLTVYALAFISGSGC